MNDTELAFKLNPKIIVWHDYTMEASFITQFINELKEEGKKIISYPDNVIAYMEVRK